MIKSEIVLVLYKTLLLAFGCLNIGWVSCSVTSIPCTSCCTNVEQQLLSAAFLFLCHDLFVINSNFTTFFIFTIYSLDSPVNLFALFDFVHIWHYTLKLSSFTILFDNSLPCYRSLPCVACLPAFTGISLFFCFYILLFCCPFYKGLVKSKACPYTAMCLQV